MNNILYLLLITVSLMSCSKTNLNKMCDVENPVTELKWLSNEIDSANANSQSIIVFKVVIKNKETKDKQKSLKLLKGQMSEYYDCAGVLIGFTGGINPSSKFEEIKSEELYRNY